MFASSVAGLGRRAYSLPFDVRHSHPMAVAKVSCSLWTENLKTRFAHLYGLRRDFCGSYDARLLSARRLAQTVGRGN
jgi:hypothetical protein